MTAPAHRSTVRTSKKLLAFVLASLGWEVVILATVFHFATLDLLGAVVLLAEIVVQGVVQVGYLVGQSGLDALGTLFDRITPDSLFGSRPPKDGAP